MKQTTDQVPPVTGEELLFALNVGGAAYSMKTPRKSFAADAKPSEGLTLHLIDNPMNHMGMTIIAAFKEDKDKARALLFRMMFVVNEVWHDPRSAKWHREVPEQPDLMDMDICLANAMSEVPLFWSGEVNLDDVFAIAERKNAESDED